MDFTEFIDRVKEHEKAQRLASNKISDFDVFKDFYQEVLRDLMDQGVCLTITHEDIIVKLPELERLRTPTFGVDIAYIEIDPVLSLEKPFKVIRESCVADLKYRAEYAQSKGKTFFMTPLTAAVKMENYLVDIFFYGLTAMASNEEYTKASKDVFDLEESKGEDQP